MEELAYITFRIPDRKSFLFDREANSVIEITSDDEMALNGCLGEVAKENCENKFQKEGFCLDSKLKTINHPDIPNLSQLLSHRVGDMVLQVTQNCNFRCEYCAYSGSYYNRTHTAKRMSLETALRAVDFLMENSIDRDTVNIGFYGGEPLLEMDLIRQIISYVETEYIGKKVTYSLTTNASLLSDETADYLMEKSVGILVSLDGPKEYHDEHRCYVNGDGSFDSVMDNLGRLKKRHPKYFERVRINSVVPPGRNIKKIVDFFSSNEVLSKTEFRLTTVSDVGCKTEIIYDDEFNSQMLGERTKMMLYGLGLLSREYVNLSFSSYFDELFYMFKLLKNKGRLPATSHPGGPCTPGIRRLFVDVDGNFFPCERVSETSDTGIGNLQSGFSEQKIANILNVGKLTEQQCKQCWAFSYCQQCIGMALDGNEICAQKRLSRCASVRENVYFKLRDLQYLLTNGFDFEQYEGMSGRE